MRPRVTLAAWAFLVAAYSAYCQEASDDAPGDVRRYGAVCDAEADDTDALVRAGRASLAVYIAPELSCRVNGPLAAGIRSGQRWYGGGTIRTRDGANFTVFSVAGKVDVSFDGLVGVSGMLGRGYAAADARFIEFIGGAHRGRVANSRIIGFQQAVRAHGSTDVVIDNNDIIEPFGWGISIQTGADRAQVVNNRVSDAVYEHGIYVSGSAANPVLAPSIRSNSVWGSRVDGIKLTYTNDAVVVDNATFDNGGQGIYLTVGTNRAAVRENLSYSNRGSGILIFDGTTTSGDNQIERNTVRGNYNHGIVVSSSGEGTVSRTRVGRNELLANRAEDGRAGYGIVVSGAGATSQTFIEHNRIADQDVGVYVGGGRDTLIGSNSFQGCTSTVAWAVSEPPD